MEKTGNDIKYFLKSKKPETLQVLMLQNNIKTSSYHDYRIIYAEGFWYAWYEFTADKLIQEQVTRIANFNK